jgi:hypothetical protein
VWCIPDGNVEEVSNKSSQKPPKMPNEYRFGGS